MDTRLCRAARTLCVVNRTPRRCAFIMAASLALAATGAFSQTITNGTFDLEVPRTSFGNGWTGFSNDGAGGWRSSGGNPGGFFIINDNGAFDRDPSISQIVTDLVVGQVYEISGDYASWIVNSAPSGGASFAADIDGVQLFTGTAGTLQAWRPFAFVFTATADTATLRLRSEINGTDNDFAVDNIAITLVPTPAGLGLFAAAGFVALRRRR
ncbi:MAG: hypothetical protein KF859_03595 [Phycisphaeraceae bacterium]|nr:hypothetical protein [Phycisphaeraceae bacterium]